MLQDHKKNLTTPETMQQTSLGQNTVDTESELPSDLEIKKEVDDIKIKQEITEDTSKLTDSYVNTYEDKNKENYERYVVNLQRISGQYPAMHPAYRAVGHGPPNAIGFTHFYPSPPSTTTSFHQRSIHEHEKHMNEVSDRSDGQVVYHQRPPSVNQSDFSDIFPRDYHNDYGRGKLGGYHGTMAQGFRNSLELAYFNQQASHNMRMNFYPARQKKWSNIMRSLQSSVSLVLDVIIR